MILDCTEALEKLHRDHLEGRSKSSRNGGHPPRSVPQDDQEIVDKARAEKGGKFDRLWRGDISEYGGDHSAADHAFVLKLYFYTQDEEQIKRIHATSGLARDKSTKRTDYLERSIDDAREMITEFYPWTARKTPGDFGRSSTMGGSRQPTLPTGPTAFLRVHR